MLSQQVGGVFGAAGADFASLDLAGVLRGVISQRLLPRIGGGRVPGVEVMVGNARIADLIRENKPEEITEAIAEGDFFQMQTFSDALIELVLEQKVDREVAANAATNRHDFLIALERALKEQAVAAFPEPEPDAPEPEPVDEAEPPADDASDGGSHEAADEPDALPRLRVAGQ